MRKATNKKENEEVGIIYKATNKTNGMAYIGMTTKSLDERKREHIVHKVNGRRFRKELKEVGEENFQWEVVEDNIYKSDLPDRESFWIEHYDTFNSGLNDTTGGIGVAYITKTEALKIKEMLLEEVSAKIISDTLKVGYSAVKHVKQGATWAHLSTEDELKKMRGETNGLDETTVAKVKDLTMKGVEAKKIASILEISIASVYRIRKGEIWRDALTDEDFNNMQTAIKKYGRVEFTEKEAKEIKDLLISGIYGVMELSKMYGVSRSRISHIKSGHTWSYLFTPEELENMKHSKPKPKN